MCSEETGHIGRVHVLFQATCKGVERSIDGSHVPCLADDGEQVIRIYVPFVRFEDRPHVGFVFGELLVSETDAAESEDIISTVVSGNFAYEWSCSCTYNWSASGVNTREFALGFPGQKTEKTQKILWHTRYPRDAVAARAPLGVIQLIK